MPSATSKCTILYLIPSCKKTGPNRQLLNLIGNLDRRVYEPLVATVYAEQKDTLLAEFREIAQLVPAYTSKPDLLFGSAAPVRALLENVQPNVVHTSGVLPDFCVARLGFANHVMTARNYVYDDYPAEFGLLKGTILAKVHLYAMRHCAHAVCCSESLQQMYAEKQGISLPCIRNGVDLQKFSPASAEEKVRLRSALNLPAFERYFVYGALFNERKNQRFLAERFARCEALRTSCLLLLGDGPDRAALAHDYAAVQNVRFPGNVANMVDYLRAADYYVSSSRSEGLPNGVLEALSSGLPILVSDIPQHGELFEPKLQTGARFRLDDENDFALQAQVLLEGDYEAMSRNAVECVRSRFSAEAMSAAYQRLYRDCCAGAGAGTSAGADAGTGADAGAPARCCGAWEHA